MSDERELTGVCSFCQFEGAKTKIYKMTTEFVKGSMADQDPIEFCDICAGSMAGNAYCYPSQYPNIEVMKMISTVGNMIMAKIDKLEKK